MYTIIIFLDVIFSRFHFKIAPFFKLTFEGELESADVSNYIYCFSYLGSLRVRVSSEESYVKFVVYKTSIAGRSKSNGALVLLYKRC